MASLPALPSLLRKPDETTSAEDLVEQVDAKLRLARRLHAEDQARRETSVAPPPRPRRGR